MKSAFKLLIILVIAGIPMNLLAQQCLQITGVAFGIFIDEDNCSNGFGLCSGEKFGPITVNTDGIRVKSIVFPLSAKPSEMVFNKAFNCVSLNANMPVSLGSCTTVIGPILANNYSCSKNSNGNIDTVTIDFSSAGCTPPKNKSKRK